MLAIDQGTRSSRAIAFSLRGDILALDQQPFEQIHSVYQTRDLLDAMATDGVVPAVLKVDDGMAQNGFFLQRLADVLALPIRRPRIAEATAWKAACLAGLGCGAFGSLEEIAELWQPDAGFEPQLDADTLERELTGRHAALRRVRTS